MSPNKKSLLSDKPLTKAQKTLTAIAIFVVLSAISLTALVPLIDFLDYWLYLDYAQLMFLSGIALGLVYYVLSIVKHYTADKIRNGYLKFVVSSLPSLYLLNCFVWYFYLFFNKQFSETKDDASYYQTVMIAFSIYFLTVKISKEFGQVHKLIHE